MRSLANRKSPDAAERVARPPASSLRHKSILDAPVQIWLRYCLYHVLVHKPRDLPVASRSAPAQLDATERLRNTLVHVVHDPRPGTARRIIDESVLEGDFAVRILEHERQRLAFRFRMAGAFGGEPAARGAVEPQNGVLARRRVTSDVDDRLVGGLPPGVLLAGHLVEADVEMVQHPFPVDVVCRVLAGHPALEDPMPDQAAEPGIVAGGRLGADGHGDDAAEGGEQQESLHGVTSMKSYPQLVVRVRDDRRSDVSVTFDDRSLLLLSAQRLRK